MFKLIFILRALCIVLSSTIFGNNFLNAQVVIEENVSENLMKNNVTNELKDQYIIGPGDVLQLNFLDVPELSTELRVISDGSVPLPIIGNFNINNLTIEQAANQIKNLFKKELTRPELQLSLKSAKPIKISVIGEVQQPGIYSLTNNEFGRLEGVETIKNSGLPTVIDAIQKAGGITKNANLKEVTLKRKLPGIDYQLKQTKLNLLDLVFEGNLTQNPVLFDGDILKIDKANFLNEKQMEIAVANLSPKIIKVWVTGEVNEPGEKLIKVSTPLSQAIMIAGGTKNGRSSKYNVELYRVNRNNSVTKKRYKLNFEKPVSEKYNPSLISGDVINVKRNSFAKTSDTIKLISEPIGGIVTSWSLLKIINN